MAFFGLETEGEQLGRVSNTGKGLLLTLQDMEYDGCGTLGITVDPPRNRVIVTIKSNAPAPNYNAVAGYDLDRWGDGWGDVCNFR